MSSIKETLLRLRHCAESATKGPWHLERDEFPVTTSRVRDVWRVIPQSAWLRRLQQQISARPDYLATVYSSADAEFFAAVTPEVVLALLDRLESLEKAQTAPLTRAVVPGVGNIGIVARHVTHWEDLANCFRVWFVGGTFVDLASSLKEYIVQALNEEHGKYITSASPHARGEQ